MGSIERKLQRNKEKQAKKDMKQKMGLFDKLGDECLTCQRPFDKKSKEQAKSWFVAVRKKENKVKLYGPECWGKAQEIIKDFGERYNERQN